MEKTIKKDKAWSIGKPDPGSGSRLRVGKVLASYNVCLKAVPLIKYATLMWFSKCLTIPKNKTQKKQNIFLFCARQGLTLLLRILIQNEKSGLRSSGLKGCLCFEK